MLEYISKLYNIHKNLYNEEIKIPYEFLKEEESYCYDDSIGIFQSINVDYHFAPEYDHNYATIFLHLTDKGCLSCNVDDLFEVENILNKFLE